MGLELVGPHIQACGYRKGREFVQRPGVNLLVIHSAEGGTSEIALGNYFATHCGGSSHAGIGTGGGYATYVNYADTPWTNPPLSQESDTLEQMAYAAWSRTQWLAYPKMLETVAHWLAWRATVRRVPIRQLTAQQIADGWAGICDHKTLNIAYDYTYSDHWDVGNNYPWDIVIPRARQIAAVVPGGTTTTTYTVRSGDTLSGIATKFHVTVAALQTANGITDPDKIYVGQVLKIPTGTVPKTGVTVKFPYPSDHYFYTTSSSPRCHSGYWPVDRPYVKMIQTEVGLTGTAVDGRYGLVTKARVTTYQKNHGLRVDGVVGPLTWGRMLAS